MTSKQRISAVYLPSQLSQPTIRHCATLVSSGRGACSRPRADQGLDPGHNRTGEGADDLAELSDAAEDSDDPEDPQDPQRPERPAHSGPAGGGRASASRRLGAGATLGGPETWPRAPNYCQRDATHHAPASAALGAAAGAGGVQAAGGRPVAGRREGEEGDGDGDDDRVEPVPAAEQYSLLRAPNIIICIYIYMLSRCTVRSVSNLPPQFPAAPGKPVGEPARARRPARPAGGRTAGAAKLPLPRPLPSPSPCCPCGRRPAAGRPARPSSLPARPTPGPLW